jgi:hypothetical protein
MSGKKCQGMTSVVPSALMEDWGFSPLRLKKHSLTILAQGRCCSLIRENRPVSNDQYRVIRGEFI